MKSASPHYIVRRRAFYGANLFGNDRLAGANACAGSAVDALIGIDHIDIAGRDRLYRAFADTSTACNACVGNFVSHCFVDFFVKCLQI